MDNFVPDQGIKDSQIVVWMMHKARQGEFSQATRDKMKQNGGKPGFMDAMAKLFQEADANQDGNLNEDEFIVFRKKVTDMQAQMNGEGVTIPDEHDRKIWQRTNDYFSDHEGVNMEDLGKTLMTFRTFGMKPESKYRIWYFEGMYGRAEVIRLLLDHANVPYEDLGVKLGDWGMLKPMVPGQSLPLIEMQNGHLKGGATRATMRYLSLTYGYYPDDPMQAQQCDMIVDAFQDTFNLSGDAAFGKGFDPSTIPDMKVKYYEKLHAFLKFLEPYCAKGQYLCGSKPCTADFWVGSMVTSLFENPNVMFGKEGENCWTDLYAQYPGFKGWASRFVAASSKRMQTRPALGF